MSLFKPLRGSRITLDAQPLHDGYAWFCTDDGSFHIDYVDADGNLQRKQINASMISRLEALEKIINNSPLVEDYEGVGTLDAGKITDNVNTEFIVIDPGAIINV